MKKEKLEEFFNSISNAEELVMYHLFKRGWKFINSFKSGIMVKGVVFFVIKNYANTYTYDNFMFSKNDIDITQINCLDDLRKTDIPLQMDFSPAKTDKCSWYISYKDKVVEKGMISQSQLFLRSQLEGKEPVQSANVKKIEKFKEMIDLIDSYASMPEYALAQYAYVEKMVKNKTEKKYVIKPQKFNIHESTSQLLNIYFKCVADTPIHFPKDKYDLIEHAAKVLGFKKLDETDTQVKISLPIRKDYFYKIVNVYTLFDLEQVLSCEVKQSSKNIKMLEMVRFSPDLTELNNSNSIDLNSLKRIYITPDMLDMLDILSSFETGVISKEDVLVETLAMVRENTDLLYDRLPKELDNIETSLIALTKDEEKDSNNLSMNPINDTDSKKAPSYPFNLSREQKEVVYKALNKNLNYSILLDGTINQDCYELLLKLLEKSAQPLQLLGRSFSQDQLTVYLEAIESGLDLDIFLDLPCEDDMLKYYVENIINSINVECEELLAEGFSQEQISYIRRAKSRKENFSYITKDSSLIQLWIKEYMHRNNINSHLCEELINSYKGTDTYTELRFADLSQESLKEIAAHLFTKNDFSIADVKWSKIQQFILTKSEAVCCSTLTGLRIKIYGNVFLSWDDNSITFYELNKPLCKIVFANNVAIVSENSTTPKLTEYLDLF